MPTVAIDILFAGLIAFVPNSTDDPSSMRVYLLEAAHHQAWLTLYGEVCFVDDQGKCMKSDTVSRWPCTATSKDLELGSKVKCDLASIKAITFDPTLEKDRRYLRRGQLSDRPNDLDSRRSLKWLPRVMNFERQDSRALEPSELERKTRTHLEIGWESAQTCAVDGGECGLANIFKFKVPGGPEPSGEQAVAEEVMFTSRIRPGPFLIHLLDPNNSEEKNRDVVLRVACQRQHCMSMLVENTFDVACPCQSAPCAEPGHFALYYELVNPPVVGRMPYKFTEVSTHEPCDLLLLECWLRLIEPVQPKRVEALRKLDAKTACSQEGLIDDRDRVHDRIVCPPVILEP